MLVSLGRSRQTCASGDIWATQGGVGKFAVLGIHPYPQLVFATEIIPTLGVIATGAEILFESSSPDRLAHARCRGLKWTSSNDVRSVDDTRLGIKAPLNFAVLTG